MKIATTRSTAMSGRGATTGSSKSGGDGFSRALNAAGPAGAQSSAAIAGPSAAAAILAVQEVAAVADGQARRRAIRRAEDLLDELDRLRLAILSGAIDPDRLIAIAAMSRARCDGIDDPALTELLAEIELRVEVELAKWRR